VDRESPSGQTTDHLMPPLIFFVHVPKTAGSTVNAMLQSHYSAGYSHSESFFQDASVWSDRVNRSEWLSGHMQYPVAMRNIGWVSERPVRFFTCVREPVAQIMSHYNWLIEIRNRGRRFYESHAPILREGSSYVRDRGSRTPQDVIAALEKYPRIFRATQAKVVLGEETPWELELVKDILGSYEGLATTDTVGDLFSKIAGIPAPSIPKANSSAYHVDPSLYETDELQDFLKRYNLKDYLLYQTVLDTIATSREGSKRTHTTDG
jgi:hypothetical protein